MEQKIRSFRELRVWQKGVELVEEIYRLTKDFPRDEQYGISAQMRRSAVSIPSNIAEGFRRKYSKEHKQFLNIALGSSAELETQVLIAQRLNYLDNESVNKVLELIDHICRMCVNLSKRII